MRLEEEKAAHVCPVAPADAFADIFGPGPSAEPVVRDFYDLDAPDEQDVDQARLVVNAPRQHRPAPPRPGAVEETPW